MSDVVQLEDGKVFKVQIGRTVTLACTCGVTHDLALSQAPAEPVTIVVKRHPAPPDPRLQLL